MSFDHSPEREKRFTRRAIFVGGLQFTMLGVLGGRLAWLQVVEGAKYKTLADNNRISTKIIAPLRGAILDRYGVPLAVNKQSFEVLILPEQTEDLQTSIKALQKYINLEPREIARVLKQAQKSPPYVPLLMADNLTQEQLARVEVHLPELAGVLTGSGQKRSYPYADATAHLIGYVGAVSEHEMTDEPVMKTPGFRIGKTGIEKQYDNDLRGHAGQAQLEVNVVGREIRELERKNPVTGKRIVLTIDAELQRMAQTRLSAEQSASAVIMDAHTGAVYALASYPAFDPNDFTDGIAQGTWDALMSDPTFPFTNKAVAGQYPPGSTYKMITALAGLEAGVIKPNTYVHCPGHYRLGKDKFHCWKQWGHGSMNVVTALMQSCDTFFYKMSNEIGIDRIAEMSRRFGLGQELGLELPSEKSGLIPDKEWKKRAKGTSWQPGETVVASIGQGYVLTTPLQLATMTARLVNGGKAVLPWLTESVGEKMNISRDWPDLEINPKHMELVLQGMNSVVNNPRGTAHGSRIADEAMAMGGKTGTAQVQRITAQQRALGIQNKDLPWVQRHHALFVGYAPIAAPRYVCSVVVEHGVGGSTAAAPIARDLLTYVQQRHPASQSPVAAG